MEGGFYQQKSLNPKAIAVVVLLHGAVLTALVMAKGERFIRFAPTPIRVRLIKEIPPPPERQRPQPNPQQQTVLDHVPPRIPLPPRPQPPIDLTGLDHIPNPTWTPPGPIEIPRTPPAPPIPVPEPVRIDARIDNGSALQPPYPASAQREGAEGTVQVRVAIGPDGRVKAVEKLRSSRDDFFAATERQALRYWRFKPATVDGKPIESSKVMTVHFRIDEAA
jgi:protein TonB